MKSFKYTISSRFILPFIFFLFMSCENGNSRVAEFMIRNYCGKDIVIKYKSIFKSSVGYGTECVTKTILSGQSMLVNKIELSEYLNANDVFKEMNVTIANEETNYDIIQRVTWNKVTSMPSKEEYALVIDSQFVDQLKQERRQKLSQYIQSIEGFVALWDFSEPSGRQRLANGNKEFALKEGFGPIERLHEGPISGYSIKLNGNNYLSISNSEAGDLNIFGKDQAVTVVSFIKWGGGVNNFVAGMWNESDQGGKRQYGLFISLSLYNGDKQVCGHISSTGKSTPPFPYSIDYSSSKQQVPLDTWCCVGFTYDGTHIKSYYNGEFQERSPELISHTKGFPGYPNGIVTSKNPYYFPNGMGNNGSDFTVGAVKLKHGMGNFFKGSIGGIAVFNKVVSDADMKALYELSIH
jgi:hypothetical protein